MFDGALTIAGGLALLLWGLRMVRTGMTRAFGARLRHWLARSTPNRIAAFMVGLGATCALQSSTATALLTTSFAGRELITIAMSLAIMLGADVGTSLVAQALTFDVHWLSPVLLVVGVTVFMASKASRPRAIGRAVLGLGLVLLALGFLIGASEPVRESTVIKSLLSALAQAPVIAAAIAAVLTVLTSSSLVIVLLTASLAVHGDLAPPVAVALVLGANLGGTVLPLVATSGAGPVARRVPVGNMVMRGSACLVALPFSAPIADLLTEVAGSSDRLAVDAHLAFNMALAVVFLPLVGVLAALLEKFIPTAAVTERGPRYLDAASLKNPAMALSCAARETMRMGDRVQEMLRTNLEALRASDLRRCSEIERMDDELDQTLEAIKIYLAKLGREMELADADKRRSTEIVSFAINLEHVGDIIDKNLRELVEKKIKHQLIFSAEGLAEIEDFFARTLESLRIAQSVFLVRDADLARQLVSMKVDIRHFERRSAEKHLERLREGRPESVQTSALHLDILRDLKRINAHIASVANPILEDAGELRDSRLRNQTATLPTVAAGTRS